jgi:hypothetical protein
MEKRFAIVQAGVVVNIAIATETMGANWVEITGAQGPGWTYDGTAFHPPAADPQA